MKSKWIRFAMLMVSLLGVLLIRAYQQDLFYDPFIEFFKENHHQDTLPELSMGKYLLHVIGRYLLNALFSLLALWALFQNKDFLKFSALLMLGLLVLLLPVLVILIETSEPGSYMGLFYVRRFLMQPLLVMLLIPAFYFQKNR